MLARSKADFCVQCDSRDNPSCAELPLHLIPTECANQTAYGCFSRIVDGHTVRGCLSSLRENECTNSPLCNSCYNVNNAQGCNNQVESKESFVAVRSRLCGLSLTYLLGCVLFFVSQQYPELRLFCHQCSGSLTTPCAGEQVEVPRMCNVFQENNQCFIRRSSKWPTIETRLAHSLVQTILTTFPITLLPNGQTRRSSAAA